MNEEKIIEQCNAIDEIIADYQNRLTNYKEELSLEGKSLGEANKEQATLMVYYDQQRVELDAIIKMWESKMSFYKGILYKKFNENYSVVLSERGKDNYINHDKLYNNMLRRLIWLQEIHDKFKSVVECFKSRGFALRNITDLRIHELENNLI